MEWQTNKSDDHGPKWVNPGPKNSLLIKCRRISSRADSLPRSSCFSCSDSAQLDLALMRCYSVCNSRSSRSAALLCVSTSSSPFYLSTSRWRANFSLASAASISFYWAISFYFVNSDSLSLRAVRKLSIVLPLLCSSCSKVACTCYIWEFRPSLSDCSSSDLFLSFDLTSDSYNSFVFYSCCRNSSSFSTAFFSSLAWSSWTWCASLVYSTLVCSLLTWSNNSLMCSSLYCS